MELGWRPIEITPVFSLGQDWIITLEPEGTYESPVYPTGTTVTARIYADSKLTTLKAPPMQEWPGEIDGDLVHFHTEADVGPDTVDAKRYMRIMIVYPGEPLINPFCWAHGKVERDD